MAVELELVIVPPVEMVVEDFVAIGLSLRSFREPLKRSVRDVVAPSIEQNFESGGRPPWPPLSESTLIVRSYDNSGDTILDRSGKLRKSATAQARWIFTTDEGSFTLPEDVWYGIVHQNGLPKKNIPQREFAVIQPEDEDKIEEVFWTWVSERFFAQGFRPGVSTGEL